MAKSKPWAELSPAYKHRLLGHGITPAMHRKGVGKQAAPNTSIKQAARGHSSTPEHGGTSYAAQAEANGVRDVIKRWGTFTPTQRNQVGRGYMQLFERGKGALLTKDEVKWLRLGSPGSNPGELQVRGVYRHPSDQQIRNRMDFMSLLRKLDFEWDKTEWLEFHNAYLQKFS